MIAGQLMEMCQKAAGMEFEERTISLHIDIAYNRAMWDVFKGFPGSVGQLCQTFNVPVVHEQPRPYSLLPDQVMSFPDAASGVRFIYTKTGDNRDFVPMHAMYFSLLKDLEIGQVKKEIGYVVRANKVEYESTMPDNITEVRMEIIKPFSHWGEDEDIPIPLGVGEQIVGLVLQSLGVSKVTNQN